MIQQQQPLSKGGREGETERGDNLQIDLKYYLILPFENESDKIFEFKSKREECLVVLLPGYPKEVTAVSLTEREEGRRRATI